MSSSVFRCSAESHFLSLSAIRHLLQLPGELLRQRDVPRLRRLVAAGEEDDELQAALDKEHSVPGTYVDLHLGDALSHGCAVAKVPGRGAVDARLDACATLPIS